MFPLAKRSVWTGLVSGKQPRHQLRTTPEPVLRTRRLGCQAPSGPGRFPSVWREHACDHQQFSVCWPRQSQSGHGHGGAWSNHPVQTMYLPSSRWIRSTWPVLLLGTPYGLRSTEELCPCPIVYGTHRSFRIRAPRYMPNQAVCQAPWLWLYSVFLSLIHCLPDGLISGLGAHTMRVSMCPSLHRRGFPAGLSPVAVRSGGSVDSRGSQADWMIG